MGLRLEQFYSRLLEESRKPSWEREYGAAALRSDGTPAGDSVAISTRKVSNSLEVLTVRVAYLRLLAVHCAIRRYWATSGRLPLRLEDLDGLYLGRLAIDPFTGEPFRYMAGDQGYSLTSIGQRMLGHPRAVDGRLPIDLLTKTP